MPAHAKPWSEQRGIKFHGLGKSARVLDCIDVCWQHRRNQLGPNVLPEQARLGLWCNPSQAVQRKPVTSSPPLLCQGTFPYSYEKDVCLSGRDALVCQGFPKDPGMAPLHAFSDSEVRSLAGEAYFLPSMLSVAYPYFLNAKGTWWNKNRNTGLRNLVCVPSILARCAVLGKACWKFSPLIKCPQLLLFAQCHVISIHIYALHKIITARVLICLILS